MSLENNFQSSQPLPETIGNSDQLIPGVELSTGDQVVIHFLAGGHSSENDALLETARGLPPASIRYLREIGDYRGAPYVITEPLPGNLLFRAWLARVAPKPVVPAEDASNPFKRRTWKVPAAPPASPQPSPGEFTALFKTPPAASGTPLPAVLATEPDAPGAGEFTRMFLAGSPPQAVPEPLKQTAAPAPFSPAPEPAHEAGEFTRMFQAPAPPPAAPPQPVDTESDEFTRMFQMPVSPQDSPTVEMAIPVLPPPPPPPNSSSGSGALAQPGELTRMPHTPGVPASASPASPPDVTSPDVTMNAPTMGIAVPIAPPGEFTRMFQTPATSPAAPPTAPLETPTVGLAVPPPQKPPQAPAPPAPSAPAGSPPGEFTRMFQAPAAPKPAAPANPAKSPVPPPSASPPAQTPGELTRLFTTPAPEVPKRVSESPMTASAPGEFTRMMQSPLAPPPPGHMFPPVNEAPAERAPGGFTQMFESPFTSPAPGPAPGRAPAPAPGPFFPPQPAPGPEASDFERLFDQPAEKAPATPRPGSDATKVFSSRDVPAPPAQQGPSEYTMMFKAPGNSPAAPTPPPVAAPQTSRPAVPAAPKPSGTYLVLVCVLAGLLVLALGVLIFVLTRKH